MKTVYDLKKLLQRFGTIIYTGNRKGDLHLLEMEIEELYKRSLMDKEQFLVAKQIIHKEKLLLNEKNPYDKGF